VKRKEKEECQRKRRDKGERLVSEKYARTDRCECARIRRPVSVADRGDGSVAAPKAASEISGVEIPKLHSASLSPTAWRRQADV